MKEILSILLNAEMIQDPSYQIHTNLYTEATSLDCNDYVIDIFITKGNSAVAFLKMVDAESPTKKGIEFVVRSKQEQFVGHYFMVEGIKDTDLGFIPHLLITEHELDSITEHEIIRFLEETMEEYDSFEQCPVYAYSEMKIKQKLEVPDLPFETFLQQQMLIDESGDVTWFGEGKGVHKYYQYDEEEKCFKIKYSIYDYAVDFFEEIVQFGYTGQIPLKKRMRYMKLRKRKIQAMEDVHNRMMTMELKEWMKNETKLAQLQGIIKPYAKFEVKTYSDAATVIDHMLRSSSPVSSTTVIKAIELLVYPVKALEKID